IKHPHSHDRRWHRRENEKVRFGRHSGRRIRCGSLGPPRLRRRCRACYGSGTEGILQSGVVLAGCQTDTSRSRSRCGRSLMSESTVDATAAAKTAEQTVEAASPAPSVSSEVQSENTAEPVDKTQSVVVERQDKTQAVSPQLSQEEIDRRL